MNKKLLKKLSDLVLSARVCADEILRGTKELEDALNNDGASDEDRLNKIIDTLSNLQKYDLLNAVSLLKRITDISDYIDAIKD